MAITITQNPLTLCQSGNAIAYAFQSDKTTQPNFAFIVEVYKNSVLHSTHRVYPENGNYGRFDVSQIAEYELNKPFFTDTLMFFDARNNALFKIIVREFYGTVPAIGLSANGNTTIVFKGKTLKSQPFDYVLHNSGGSNFRALTYFDNFDLHYGEALFLYTLLALGQSVKISFYDASSAEVYTETLATPDLVCLGVHIGYDSLQGMYFTHSANFKEVKKVTFNFASPNSIKYTINLHHDYGCVKPVRVHWLNNLGGMDSFSFTRPTREERSVRTSSYEIAGGSWNGGVFTSEPEVGNFQTESSNFLTLNSGYVSEKVQKIIYNNLISSPYVLVELNSVFNRVATNDITVTYNKDLVDQVFNVTLKVNIDNYKSVIV